MAINYNKIAIIGLGYVGLPLFLSFSSNKYEVIGFDNNKKRVQELNLYHDRNNEHKSNFIKKVLKKNIISNDIIKISDANFFILTIPTPILKNKKPDLRSLNKAIINVSKFIKKGNTIILESTVYPGYTDDVAIPLLEKYSKLKCNRDFYVGYSPERINPGDNKNTINNIIKIVSSSSLKNLNKIYLLYKKGLGAKIHKVKSIKAAESAKIIENTQRDLNIALINEFSMFLDKMNINYEEVMKAANTKWNFLNFKRGLVGGHCISIDPYYLLYKSKQIGLNSKIIESARRVNDNMPNYFTRHLIKKYNLKNKSKILILGFAFKENCSDIRNSLIYDLYKNFLRKNIRPTIIDPIINIHEVMNEYKIIVNDKLIRNNYSLIILAKKHKAFYDDKSYQKIINIYKAKNKFFEI